MGAFMLTGNRIAGARLESDWDRERRLKEEKKSEPKPKPIEKTEAEKPAVGLGVKVYRETMRRLEKLNEQRKEEAEKTAGGMTKTEERLAEFLGTAERVVKNSDVSEISSDQNSEGKNSPGKESATNEAVFPELPLGISSDTEKGGKKSRRGRRRKNKGGENSEG